jgi:hypothetical protein
MHGRSICSGGLGCNPMTLEELIRDRATKGELTHFSLGYEISSGMWCAVYAPSQEFGTSVARDKDPVKACEQAITAPKTTKRRKTVTATVSIALKEDTLDSWLPRA